MNKIILYEKINAISQKLGINLSRFPSRGQRRLISYLNKNKISSCFDVGANTGQFAKLFRSCGFKGEIISFEPQKIAYKKLSEISKNTSLWKAVNLGLGDENGFFSLNVSRNSVSSSILQINDLHTIAAPESEYIFKEDITVKRLDNYLQEINFNEKFFLKIDAQGFESKILDGAEGCFDQIYAIQLETACLPLYNGELLYNEMIKKIEAKGFFLTSIENGFADELTGKLLQIEVIFLREKQL